ncbi:MAG: CDP-glycerol--glycerophosphate glycerophosphotransferase [Deltaproteobacteria bacterium]|nr:MAG: CDP-glycerol--glycerophosphate glycerophosphotransferase [Deltaproteobacteria bacterium]
MMRSYLLFATQLYAFSILRPLQEAIRQRGDDAAWFVVGPLASYLKPDERLLETVADVKEYNPEAVFVAGNVVPDFFPGIKIEVFHGFHVHKRSSDRGHYRIRGFFDLYCTQGPDTTRYFQQLAEKHRFFRVVETGWPKMDPLFGKTFIRRSHRRPVILFASTFTPRLSAAMPLEKTIRTLAGSDQWRWIVHFHPKMDRAVVDRYRAMQNENLTFIETDDTIPLLQQADVIVSDTSSIIPEFCLCQKPAVTFRNRRPGPHLLNITDPSDLRSAIEQALSKPPALMTAIQEYTEHIHPYRDGRSSVRVLKATDQFIARGRQGLARKPLNLLRRLKVRKMVGYYRWH